MTTDERTGAVYIETDTGLWCPGCNTRLERVYNKVTPCPICTGRHA